MPVDLLEAPVLVPEVAPLAVEAELLPVESPAVLTLILVVQVFLLLAIVNRLHIFALRSQFVEAVSVLALDAISAEASFRPVLAHLALVHGSLHEALASGKRARGRRLLLNWRLLWVARELLS